MAAPVASTLRRIFLPFSIAAIAFILLPVIVVVSVSLGDSATYQFPPTGFSLRWFQSFLENGNLFRSFIGVSIPLALMASVTASLIGTLAAIGIVRVNFTGKAAVEAVFLGPILFPHIVLSVSLLLISIRAGIDIGIAALVCGHVLICTPYVIRTVVAGLSGIDIRIEHAAQNLGASPVRAFLLVTLPLLRSSIISGALFAFIVSFSDVNLSLFLSTADTTTLPIQILSEMQYSNDPTIAAASTIQILAITFLLLLVQRIFGRIRV